MSLQIEEGDFLGKCIFCRDSIFNLQERRKDRYATTYQGKWICGVCAINLGLRCIAKREHYLQEYNEMNKPTKYTTENGRLKRVK